MIELADVTYTGKSGKVILERISCQFQSGVITAVLGANGAGKSTLFKCIANEIKYQQGQIFWDNTPIAQLNTVQLSMERAILRQHYQVSLPFTALEIIEMGRYAYFKNHLTDRCREVVQLISELVGVTHLHHRPYPTLSGGEQQRVQLARVMCQIWDSPSGRRVLMLDEPVSALDIQYQHQLMQIMQILTQKHNFTVIAIVHDLNLTIEYADNVLLLKAGQLLAQGDVASVLTPDHIEKCFDVPATIIETELGKMFIQIQPRELPKFNF